jgi:hypothetical protein
MPQQNQPQGQQGSFVWGKVAGMIFAVGLPAALVIAANHKVFPDSSWLASGMVVTTFAVAVIFAVASSFATRKVRKYVLIAALVLSVELAANLAVHWVLSREVSGAKQATTARHDEEDREEARRESEAKRQKEMLDKQRELLAEQKALAAETARQLRMEAIRNDSARRLGIRAPRGATVSAPASVSVTVPSPTAEPSASPAPPAGQPAQPNMTVEQVMEKWVGWLLAFAILDLLTSVVAFGVCALLWEWDLNRDGIPDHLQARNSTTAGQWVSRNGQDWVWVGPGEPMAPPPGRHPNS